MPSVAQRDHRGVEAGAVAEHVDGRPPRALHHLDGDRVRVEEGADDVEATVLAGPELAEDREAIGRLESMLRASRALSMVPPDAVTMSERSRAYCAASWVRKLSPGRSTTSLEVQQAAERPGCRR